MAQYLLTLKVVVEMDEGDDPVEALQTYLAESGVPEPVSVELLDAVCANCGLVVEPDDGIWYHAGSMEVFCDPEGGQDLARQAEPVPVPHDWQDRLGDMVCTRCGALMSQGPDVRALSPCPAGTED